MNEPTKQQIDAAFEEIMSGYEELAFTDLDRAQATKEGIQAFMHLLRERLLSGKPLPTVAECEGLVILALDFLTYTPSRPPSPYGKGQF